MLLRVASCRLSALHPVSKFCRLKPVTFQPATKAQRKPGMDEVLPTRNIQKREQITDEYGIFNLTTEMEVSCGMDNCRKKIKPDDFDNYYNDWDQKIKNAITHLFEVEQPLMPFIEEDTRKELDAFFQSPELYKSVYSLKLK